MKQDHHVTRRRACSVVGEFDSQNLDNRTYERAPHTTSLPGEIATDMQIAEQQENRSTEDLPSLHDPIL